MCSIARTAATYLACKAIGLKTKAKNYSSRDVDQILLLPRPSVRSRAEGVSRLLTMVEKERRGGH